jgi:hypothetical protein
MRIECPACGSEKSVQPDDRYLRCSYCDSMLHVELGDCLEKTILNVTINQPMIPGLIRRALKDHELTHDITIGNRQLTYYPFWKFSTETQVRYKHAITVTEPFWDQYTVEAGERSFFERDDQREGTVLEPDIYLDAALVKLGDTALAEDPDMTPSLVFVPFYTVECTVSDRPVTGTFRKCFFH